MNSFFPRTVFSVVLALVPPLLLGEPSYSIPSKDQLLKEKVDAQLSIEALENGQRPQLSRPAQHSDLVLERLRQSDGKVSEAISRFSDLRGQTDPYSAFVEQMQSPMQASTGTTGQPSASIRADGPVGSPMNEPLFGNAWHLANTGTNGGKRGEDINILAVWEQGYSGKGSVIGIVDSAVDVFHPDLISNHRWDLSYDFIYDDPEPWLDGVTNESHGTAVAGLAVAANNGLGTIGAGYGAHFASLRLGVGGSFSNASAFRALSHKSNLIGIYNISWGYGVEGMHFESIPELARLGIQQSVTNGRASKGSVYVVAAGNHRNRGAMTNYFALTSSRFTIPVGAVDSVGEYSYYSNPGSTLFVCAPGSGFLSGVTTTDARGSAGYDSGDYYHSFGGTSAAAPIVSGVVALMLEANPNLGWRDVKHILANSAFPIDYFHSDWQINGAGLLVNHNYGFGRVDATAAVALSKRWTNVPNIVELKYNAALPQPLLIPDDDETGVETSITVDKGIRIEHVEVYLKSDHTYWGDFRLSLVSPEGTVCELTRPHVDRIASYGEWTFSTVFPFGESSLGEWTLLVSDEGSSDSGAINSWSLTFYGTELTEGSNLRPAVENDVFTVDRNSGNVVDILANDHHPAGSPFSPISFYQPAYGTLVYDQSGSLVYTPDQRFAGIDYFGYTVADPAGMTGKGIATLRDPRPFANDDQIVTQINKPVRFDPTSNDTDIESQDLSVIAAGNPTSGQILQTSGNSLTYEPLSGFRGLSQFEYVVTDNTDGTDVGLVNAFVSSMDDYALLFDDKEDSVIVIQEPCDPQTGFSYEIKIFPFSYGHHNTGMGLLFESDSLAIALANDSNSGDINETLLIYVFTESGPKIFVAPNGSVRLNSWQHVAVSFEAGIGLKLFIDGADFPLRSLRSEDSGVPIDPDEIFTSEFVVIGNTFSRVYGFDGLLDDYRSWDTARNASQLQQGLEGLQNSDFEALSPLLCNLAMNEGVGIFLGDRSFHQNTGYILGAIWSPKDLDLIQFQKDHFLGR